jgi:putative toxin-antitoxin system antitoxin component (TIGR02293 family)
MAEWNRAAEPDLADTPPGDFYALMEGKLGVPRIRSGEDLASIVEKRLPATVVKALVRGGLLDAEVYQLIVPRRTLAHRIAKHQPLSQEESDKAVRVARITAKAEQVFGEPERAWRWLREPKRRFDGKAPMEMIATDAGGRLVEEMIGQIEHGMLA